MSGYKISSLCVDGRLLFNGPQPVSHDLLEISLRKPDGDTPLTMEFLGDDDKEWLTIRPSASLLDWEVRFVKLKALFQLDDLPWLPQCAREGNCSIEGTTQEAEYDITIRVVPGNP